ncbi:MAG: FAD-dependent oxidoreductase [Bacteroidales bacterium]|nr:FAD-dependent oxidoreductase [Bacteroidales bacterium]
MKRSLFTLSGLLSILLSSGFPTVSQAQPVPADGLFVEAESFTSKGGWSVDQQFMDQMGSPYLIAHGMGVPVADASTSLDIPEAGVYHVWVRTYNWTSPWTSSEGPGAFRIKIDGKPLKTVLGVKGDSWQWQYAGSARLKPGQTTLALSDLKGFDGRCDALWLTKEEGNVPPADKEALRTFRRKVGALPEKPSDGGEYDFVVIGGGVAGMCAAVSAARFGCKVALVNDRPIPGGNNSSEIRVHLGAYIEQPPYPALGRMLREFGHSKGGNAQPASNYEDDKKLAFIEGQEGLTYLPCFRAVKVNMEGSKIASVVIRNIETAEERLLRAPLFADCTGDGNLGFMAGADWMMGREGRDEFGESLAPEKGDKLTMGSSVQWYSVEEPKKSSFPEFEYGVKFTEENSEKVTMGEWTWETGMNLDQINDFERIRDYGLLVVYSNWSFLKNHCSKKEDYANRSLGWVAYVAGKRESRRLVGDYILKQDDVDKQVFHEDASFTMTWHFDLHFPDPANSANFPGNEFKAATKSNPIYPYAAPYRCLYSRNIDNLFMAGRDISTTHVTLGSTRLMRTGAMMGEVVGMAASVCKEKGTTPRGVYQHYLPELKELMKKGAGRTNIQLPDNQHFNEGGHLKKPKDIVF